MAPPAMVLRAMNNLRIAELPDVGRTDQAVLVELVSYVSTRQPKEPVYPRAQILAERLHLAYVTVRRALTRLDRAGLIERLPQEHSDRTGNFRTVRTRISDQVLRIAGLIECAKIADVSTHVPAAKNDSLEPESSIATTPSDTLAEIPANGAPEPQAETVEGSHRDTRPCISGIHATENKTNKNKNSKSTANGMRTHFARKDSLPEDLRPWVDRGIAPAALATSMKLARQAGTTLSAVLVSIGERLSHANHPQAYLISTLRRLTDGQEGVWNTQRPSTTLSPQEAALREKNETQALAKLEGQWFTDGKCYYRPVGRLCEVYSAPPTAGKHEPPDSAPIPSTRLQKWIAEQRVAVYTVPCQDYDVSLLRKALSGCMV